MSDPLSQWRDWLKTLSLGRSFERRDAIRQNEPRDSPPNQPLFKKLGLWWCKPPALPERPPRGD